MQSNTVKILPALLLLTPFFSFSQMITGVWKGKINKQTVEVKIIQNGDSLTGTSYYYTSATNYRRYSIKGYFDKNTNETIWWDDQLIDQKNGKYSVSGPGKTAMLVTADFNCPGGARMMLDGKAAAKENEDRAKGDVHLDKMDNTSFNDEWNYVIENYTVGANDPYIIDSINAIAYTPPVIEKPVVEEKPEPVFTLPEPKAEPVVIVKKEEPVIPAPPPIVRKTETIEEKFTSRQKEFTLEIPVTGDSIELRFYDNAEIDGDSISLFLNNKLIFEHIKLSAVAYTIKLPVEKMLASNELIMVAENLGEIPPNTSYMVAIVGDKRYEAMLKSTEETSAAIKLVK